MKRTGECNKCGACCLATGIVLKQENLIKKTKLFNGVNNEIIGIMTFSIISSNLIRVTVCDYHNSEPKDITIVEYFEPNIKIWLNMHGCLESTAYYIHTYLALFTKLDSDTLKMTLFQPCKHLVLESINDDPIEYFCDDYENRPKRCRDFPINFVHMKNHPNCSYKFEEEKK